MKIVFCAGYLAIFEANEYDKLYPSGSAPAHIYGTRKMHNNAYTNIKFRTEKQVNHSIVFLDAFISGIDNQNVTLQTS